MLNVHPMIRRAVPDDATRLSVLALRSKAYWGYDAAFMTRARSELTLAPDQIAREPIYVLAEGDHFIGFYALRRIDAVQIELTDLFVAPERIGSGYGRRLWQHAVATARQLGYAVMTLDADPNAEAFYLRMGAVRIGATPSHVMDGRLLPRLRYDLSPAPDCGAEM